MNITERPIDSLTPYENNPRKNDNAVVAVANSIAEFGFKVPIVVDGDGVIIAGHTRLKAAQQLGLKTVPVVVADDLTPEQAKAFRLADNRTADLALWDFGMLNEDLAELDGLLDMGQFGFDGLDFDDDFFDDQKQAPAKEEHKTTCPSCGYEF